MVTIDVLGTSDASTEEELEALTEEILAFCKERPSIDDPYVEFPVDRMKMDLGKELVVEVCGLSPSIDEEISYSRGIHEVVKSHFPKAKVGLQMVEAETICGFKE